MGLKVPITIFPATKVAVHRNEYTDSLQNMFTEAYRTDANLCTYHRWETTSYVGPFSELQGGFLSYIS
ncbi:MAG: hypothetical protein OEW12_05580 [Deltaproteobacteria bacterium]|nr:hypothetical protein [Deltaproteobacteria bacterium]